LSLSNTSPTTSAGTAQILSSGHRDFPRAELAAHLRGCGVGQAKAFPGRGRGNPCVDSGYHADQSIQHVIADPG
jgi:hypothetical protein